MVLCCGVGDTPLIAVVRQRKRNEWVLPKGKLDDGETPSEAAQREVLEETGHDVAVHEFLGTLVYQSGGRSKVVHFWRMEAEGGPVRKLMNDIKAVDWLPLDDALARLSREYERAFLTQVGPIAIAAAGLAPSPRRADADARGRRHRRSLADADTAPRPPLSTSCGMACCRRCGPGCAARRELSPQSSLRASEGDPKSSAARSRSRFAALAMTESRNGALSSRQHCRARRPASSSLVL